MPSPYVSNYGITSWTAATLTVTAAAHAGHTIVSDLAATQTATLPAATGSGNRYRFVVNTTKTGDLVIQVVGDDIMKGTATLLADGGDTVVAFATAADSDTVTLDGTTTGGIAGAEVELIDIKANTWFVRVLSDASGTEATPFSAAVT